MSAKNSTPTIGLPLFIGTDKPAWLVDFNGAMNAIDSAIANLQTAEGGTASSLASLAQSVEALSGTVNQHTTSLQTITNAVAGNTGSINTINSLIGNGKPTTEDKTIIGAINEIYGEIGGGDGVNADEVNYSNTSSGLQATNVQAAIDEVNGKISSITPDAEDVSYDNTQSGLTASNVQAAIDELANNSHSVTYSTTERAIGTDTDGAVIYEKTYVAKNVSLSSNTVIDANLNLTTVKTLIDLQTSFKTSDGYHSGIISITHSGTEYTVMAGIGSDGLNISITTETVTEYHMTVRYTKNA